jgi:hypothetical protein
MVKEIKWHTEQDNLRQGVYESDGKYCAVGCSIQTMNAKLGKHYSHGDHTAYEAELGIPRIVARLEDKIFEELQKEDAIKWPLQFMRAVPVGADLEMVWPKFAIWLLGDPKDGVIQYAKTDEQRKVVQDVVDLYAKKVSGVDVSIDEWQVVRDAAYAAAYATATTATTATTAAAYAAYADGADADGADGAAAAAAAYADAAYADAARDKHYKKCAKKLLQIIKESSK